MADPGFFREGCANFQIGIILQIFGENCMKLKELGPPGGLPLDLPMSRYCFQSCDTVCQVVCSRVRVGLHMTTEDMFKLLCSDTNSGFGPAPGPFQTGSLVTHTSIGKQAVGLCLIGILVKDKQFLCRPKHLDYIFHLFL